MDSKATVPIQPSPKPLGLLGRDEMNLAEFPISLLTDRVPKDQGVAVYQDEIHDERTGLTLTRKLTITAGNHGLTTAADDDVILSLIQLTREKNNFTNRRVEFSRHELVQRLGWAVGGASYDRLMLSLKRWTSVFLQYENAWRDNRTKTWTTTGFHIIDKYEITDTRSGGGQMELLPSYIVWGEDLFESFQAGYLKPLDYDLCMGLRNSTAKRMYRFLDKRFHHKRDWLFDLKELAHEHIGMGRHYEGPAHLKRNLQPAILELESVGFLEPLPEGERFPKNGKNWKIRLIQKANTQDVGRVITLAIEPETPPLVTELNKRGVTVKSATDLVKQKTAEYIQSKIDVFDWMVEKQDKGVAKSPAGYLVRSIEDDYAQPEGFVSRAERERLAEASKARVRESAERKRLERQKEAAELAERQMIDAHWASLSPAEQEDWQARADALVPPEQRANETGPLKKMGQHMRRISYIRQQLQDQGKLPPTQE